MKLTQRFEASNGVTWTKHVATKSDSMSGAQYRRSDEKGTVSESAFHGAKAAKTKDIVIDGNSVPDRDTEIPVPSDNKRGYEYVTVEQRVASSVGEYVARDDVDGDRDVVVIVDGDPRQYPARGLRFAYRQAGEYRESPVRYLQ